MAKLLRPILATTLTAVLAAALFFSAFTPAGISSADSFTVEFPTENYIQTDSASKISANANWTLVYDGAARILNAKKSDGTLIGTDLSALGNLDEIFALGDTALAVTEDGGYYSIALIDEDPSPKKVNLSSPAVVTRLSCDGERLYAQSAFGYLSVYDSDLKLVHDNILNEAFTGKNLNAGADGVFYTFGLRPDGADITAFDIGSGTVKGFTYSRTDILDAKVGNVIFLLTSESVVALDKSDGTQLFDTGLKPEKFAVNGNLLYTLNADGGIEYFSVNSSFDGLDRLGSMGMSGSDSGHLDKPSDVCIFSGSPAIADKANNRVMLTADKTVYSVSAPERVAAGKSELYAASGSVLSVISRGGEITAINGDYPIADVVYAGKPYIAASDGISYLFGGRFVKLSDISGVRRLACTDDGKYLYALTDSGAVMISCENGEIFGSVTDESFAAAKDIAVDYAGDLFILFDKKIVKYSNNLSDIKLVEQYPITSDALSVTPLSFTLGNDGSAYFVTEECFMGKISVNAVDKDSFLPPTPPTISPDAPYSFAEAADNGTVFLYGLSGRADDASKLDPNETVIQYQITAPDGFAYVLYSGAVYLARSDSLISAAPSAIDKDYVALKDAVLYLAPDLPADLLLKEGDKIRIADDAAGYSNGKWFRTQIEGKLYFVKASDFKPYAEEKPENERKYGKTKASRIGGLVQVYSAASADSEIISELKDGVRVELVEQQGDFYLVRFDGGLGYILKSDIITEGLTTVQIIAIVLTVVALLAGMIVFAAIYKSRKKAENKS